MHSPFATEFAFSRFHGAKADTALVAIIGDLIRSNVHVDQTAMGATTGIVEASSVERVADPDTEAERRRLSEAPCPPPPAMSPPPSPPAPPPAPRAMSAKCPHEDGWGYLFEIEDVDGVSDLPNSNNEIANGFQYENSYYVGNEALDTMIPDTGGTASICSGTTHDTDGNEVPGCDLVCVDIDDEPYRSDGSEGRRGFVVEGGARNAGGENQGIAAIMRAGAIPASLKALGSSFKKMLACFAGQCMDASLANGDARLTKLMNCGAPRPRLPPAPLYHFPLLQPRSPPSVCLLSIRFLVCALTLRAIAVCRRYKAWEDGSRDGVRALYQQVAAAAQLRLRC